MHFISQTRYNPDSGRDDKYYRIKESFRDKLGRVRSRILLNVGFWSGLKPEEVRDVGRGLTFLQEHRDEVALFDDLFNEYSEQTRLHISKFWSEMVESGAIDISRQVIKESEAKARKMLDSESVKHTDARELGAEWMTLQSIGQLRIEEFLKEQGWSDRRIKAAISMLMVRTVYCPSEFKSRAILRDNSATCELVYGEGEELLGYRAMYNVAPELYAIKSELEQHLCRVTDNLFNQENRILLFDLTNFYFEGSKRSSQKAKFGRSKEKRSDCKLLVLALCINTDGFIRYSSILEGNTADPKSLPHMIEEVIAKSPLSDNSKALVVMDAGIATEENLSLIKSKGYNYLCVSRTKLKDYELTPSEESILVNDCKGEVITLRRVQRKDENGDYYLQVNSPQKLHTEESMNGAFKERFELELTKAKQSLSRKGGTKTYEKVIERIGRAMQKYPSIAKFYDIKYTRSTADPKLMSDLSWSTHGEERAIAEYGAYYLRTNVSTLDEKSIWDYYNLIREIECTNRQLKTDLNLRPIYHQTDDRSEAHLFFGLLAYWVVNNIRVQLKEKGIRHYWKEIVRIMSTQKAVTTEATNMLGEKVILRICSDPPPNARKIYQALNYTTHPFRKIKICSTQ